VFKRLRARFGGGTTVDTVVHTPLAQPGGALEGVVEIVGGEFEQEISYLALSLVTRVEVETDEGEHQSDVEFAEQRVHGAFTLHPAEKRSVPFRIGLPHQTPFTVIGGTELPKVRVAVRTELEIARSLDKGDLDPIRVAIDPDQERIVAAFEDAGCRFRGSDVERSRLPGSALPFHQELEFAPPPELAGRLQEVEVVLLAGPDAIDVLVEGDRRGGLFDAGGDRAVRFGVPRHAVRTSDLVPLVREHLHELGRRRGLFG
jgi:sporulation-control protein